MKEQWKTGSSLVVQVVKVSICSTGDLGSIPGSGRFPWRREWLHTLVFLPEKFCGQRSLVNYSPWGPKELDMTVTNTVKNHTWNNDISDFSKILDQICTLIIGRMKNKFKSVQFREEGKFWKNASAAGYNKRLECYQSAVWKQLSTFPGGSEDRVCLQCRKLSSVPGLGRSLGEGSGNPLQYSCLENSFNRGAWLAIVHGVIKSLTQLND